MQHLNLYTATPNKRMLKKRKGWSKKDLQSVEEKFFIVLCRCKIGILEEDLTARFRISESLVSRIIVKYYDNGTREISQ